MTPPPVVGGATKRHHGRWRDLTVRPELAVSELTTGGGVIGIVESPAMKIYVNRIPEEGVQEETSYDPKALDMGRDDVRLDEPIAVSSFITKADQEVVVQVEASCQLRLCCARCLEEFTTPLRTAATLSYAVKPTDVVDITDDVRQEIMLAYPMVPVCRPSCKGLCPLCGQNLNVAVCAHQQGL